MKTKYIVVLPIEVGGTIYQHGAEVELDETTAALYSHAIRTATDQPAPAAIPPAAPKHEGE